MSMGCDAAGGAGHGERGWPARAGAGWGAASGGAAASPECPTTASASVTSDFLGAATRTAPRATEIHNELGNGDVDNNPPVSQVDKRAAGMLDIPAGQLDGSKSMCTSVQRQAAGEDEGWQINQPDPAVDPSMTDVTDVNERTHAGTHDATIDQHDGSNHMCSTVHRIAAESHDSLVIEQAPRKPYAFHVIGERPRQGTSASTHTALARAHMQTIVCSMCDSLVCLQAARAAARRRRDVTLAAADGCYSCSRHGRCARWTSSQRAMAEAVLDGRRVLVERPAAVKGRMPQRMLPRAVARAHANWVLACLE